MFRKLWSRFVSLMRVKLWCDHQWHRESIEEISERGGYRITIRCVHCGRRDCFPDC